jgi:hypothetical protein
MARDRCDRAAERDFVDWRDHSALGIDVGVALREPETELERGVAKNAGERIPSCMRGCVLDLDEQVTNGGGA